jgi:C4-dicarboxylate transporter DctM subunit
MGLDPVVTGSIVVAALFILMMIGVPIVFSLGVSGIIGALLGYGPAALGKAGASPFSTAFNLSWTALPLFVLLGTIIASSGMGEGVFKAAANWLSRIRGGLVAAGIIGEGVLAATLGTSAATFIIVGCIAGLSIGKLFIAGVIPGLILIAFLAIPAVAMAYLRPGLAPKGYSVAWAERWRSLLKMWPIIVVMGSILGCIYAGIGTATETAGIGVVATLIIAVGFFKMRWPQLKEALKEAAMINGMILFIIFAANFFTYVLGSTNITSNLQDLVASSSIPPYGVIAIIMVILLVLGCILDPITITLLTIPIWIPLIKSLGFDPIWFTVLFCVNTQIGLITPPMGTDLFAVRTIFNIPTMQILKGVLPFLGFELVFLALLAAVPQLSLWLPNLMIGK